jgi:hypothetical protein
VPIFHLSCHYSLVISCTQPLHQLAISKLPSVNLLSKESLDGSTLDSGMSLLHETSLIPNAFLYRKPSNDPVTSASNLRHLNALRKYVSSSTVSSQVVSSLDKLGSTLSVLRHGQTREEREEYLRREERKQILYLRMREVRPALDIPKHSRQPS